MHTDGERDTLDRALASVAKQDYRGEIRILLVCDRCDAPSQKCAVPVQAVRIDLPEKVVITRLAKLRDIAIRLAETPLLCFLDDDNWWEHNHLSSLVATMNNTGAHAAHSWRTLHFDDGSTFDGSFFPWLERNTPDERSRFQTCLRNKMIIPGDSIVRDQSHPDEGGDSGMVDLGAWLLDTEIARLHGFSGVPHGAKRPTLGVGEDDILLAQLVKSNTLIACSRQATLHYQLGGFSNAPQTQAKGWGVSYDP